MKDIIYCLALEFIMRKELEKIRELISRKREKLKSDIDRLTYLWLYIVQFDARKSNEEVMF